MLRGIQRLVRVRKLNIDLCLEFHDIQNGLAPTNHRAQSHQTVRGSSPSSTTGTTRSSAHAETWLVTSGRFSKSLRDIPQAIGGLGQLCTKSLFGLLLSATSAFSVSLWLKIGQEKPQRHTGHRGNTEKTTLPAGSWPGSC